MLQQQKIRTAFIFIVFCSLYGIFLFNVYVLQIRQRTFFTDLGKRQYNVTVTSMPPRAHIIDRVGNPLAFNQEHLSAFILPKELKSPVVLASFLKKHFPASVERLAHNTSHFMFIKRKLTPDQLLLIQSSALEDIHLLKEPSRSYPLTCAGHIVGITDIDNKGLFGIELLYNEHLAGKPSTYALEQDARSGHFFFKRETKIAGHEGVPIQLTLDNDLQFLAHEELMHTVEQFQAQEGAVLVMNPTTGELIAMAQYPAFDPNDTTNLAQDLTKNKLVTNVHEPGSIMKVFLALAALEEKVVTPDELIDCENTKVGIVNGFKFGTVHAEGVLPFTDVIARSNNIGIVKVALRLGPKLYDHYCRVGFGKRTNLNWPGEQSGYVNPPHKWSRSSPIVLSFGYEITASLLQLACAFSIMANDGYLVKPTIIPVPAPLPRIGKPLYAPETIAAMRSILEKAVATGTGTRALIKGYTVMGKTGTANLVINGHYDPDHNAFTFSGIVEKGNYKRVIITFVKDSPQKELYASTVAAPLFERVAEKVLIHDSII